MKWERFDPLPFYLFGADNFVAESVRCFGLFASKSNRVLSCRTCNRDKLAFAVTIKQAIDLLVLLRLRLDPRGLAAKCCALSTGWELFMQVTETIKYVGVNDHDIDLFEGQYDVRENGMAYNSYVVVGEKVAVADTVDAHFVDEWLGNVEAALSGRMPDYLVVHHMEPDHSAGIVAFMDRYPEARIVASKMAFKMMAAYFGTDFSDRQIVCKEGFELDLGGRTLRFIGAANVHWPEVMFSYDSQDKVLFSADAFGKFGANDIEDPEGWACEARRYYFGIVGKFGKNAKKVLPK